ncbi:transmembrane emp24 domain-containing protein p24beta2-like [Wolffia australiana]
MDSAVERTEIAVSSLAFINADMDRHGHLFCPPAAMNLPVDVEMAIKLRDPPLLGQPRSPHYSLNINSSTPLRISSLDRGGRSDRCARRTPMCSRIERRTVLHLAAISILSVLWAPVAVVGVRFVIDRDECFSTDVPYEGDTVSVSFVVIKVNSWKFSEATVDFVVKDPSGVQIRDSRGKISDMFDFTVRRKGVHRFCFINNSPYHETIDFDIHIAHFAYREEHAKYEHFAPILEQIAKLEEAMYMVQFQQHWLDSQTERQALLNQALGRRAVAKALFESAALVGASSLQVYLLRRLFLRKLPK